LDNDLVPSQLCDFDAYSALLKQKIRPALVFFQKIFKKIFLSFKLFG